MAAYPTSKPAMATIESITQLSRQELAETLNTKILVAKQIIDFAEANGLNK